MASLKRLLTWGATLLEAYPGRAIAAGLIAFAVGVIVQIRHVIFDLPGSDEVGGGAQWVLAVLFYVYLALAFGYYVVAYCFAIPPEPGNPERSWLDRGAEVLLRVRARGAAVGWIAAGLTIPLLVYFWLTSSPLALPVLLAGMSTSWRIGQGGARKLRRVIARLALFLLLGNAVGELLWIASSHSSFREIVTYRNYTIWALCTLAYMIAVVGRISDAVGETWYYRLACVALVITSIVVLRMFLPGVYISGRSAQPACVDASGLDADWLIHLNNKLDRMADNTPAIVVAASGGGSRAAQFTTMVLELLERTNLDGDQLQASQNTPSLADQILMISSVSGGSVATAHFVCNAPQELPQRENPTNTFIGELKLGMRKEADRIERKPTESPGADEARQLADAATIQWPLSSRRLDEMSADFNAPLLRSVLALSVERGESVSRVWREHLGWERPLRPRSGYKVPAVLFNTADVGSGLRVIVGLPALPAKLLAQDSPGQTDLPEAWAVASPLSMEEAVRVSANFPWVFELPWLVDENHPPARVVDGGTVDNSGIDTLDIVFKRLAHSARQPTDEPIGTKARLLLGRLKRQGVLILVIDSGERIGEPAWPFSSSLGLPVHGFRVASQAQAEETRRLRVERIRKVLEEPDDENGQLPGVGLEAITYRSRGDIMTAWALGPTDKGSLVTQFLVEMHNQREVLAGSLKALRNRAIAARILREKFEEAAAAADKAASPEAITRSIK